MQDCYNCSLFNIYRAAHSQPVSLVMKAPRLANVVTPPFVGVVTVLIGDTAQAVQSFLAQPRWRMQTQTRSGSYRNLPVQMRKDAWNRWADQWFPVTLASRVGSALVSWEIHFTISLNWSEKSSIYLHKKTQSGIFVFQSSPSDVSSISCPIHCQFSKHSFLHYETCVSILTTLSRPAEYFNLCFEYVLKKKRICIEHVCKNNIFWPKSEQNMRFGGNILIWWHLIRWNNKNKTESFWWKINFIRFIYSYKIKICLVSDVDSLHGNFLEYCGICACC